MNASELDFVREIMENSDGSETRIGDFVIRRDYGIDCFYDGPGGEVVIPEEIGRLDLSNTFKDVKNITSLSFPKTAKSVTIKAFGSRATLRNLKLSEGIEEIPETNSFANCKVLEEVILPESLKYVGAGAFKKTPWYSNTVETDNGCFYLGRFLVDSEEDITFATVREGTTMICGKAFLNRTGLTGVKLPDTLRIIGAQAFFGCTGLTEVLLPEQVSRVEKWSFGGCSSLKRIDIPATNVDISEDAFGSEKFGGLYLPDYAFIPTDLKGSAAQMRFFVYCYLTSRERHTADRQKQYDAEVKKRKAKLLETSIDNENLAVLRNLAPIAVTRANIQSLVETAQQSGNPEITAFLLSESSRLIADDAGKQGEKKAKSLIQSPTVAELKKQWSFKDVAEGNLELTKYKGIDTTVTVPEIIGKKTVTAIGKECFASAKIVSVSIPDTVTVVGNRAFFNCKDLCSINIPESVTEIGAEAFRGCVALADTEGFVSVNDILFDYVGFDTQVALPKSIKIISEKAFHWKTDLREVVASDNLTEIQADAFTGCKELTTLTLPATTRTISGLAFILCEKLTIHAPADSYAERDAKRRNISFVPLQTEDAPSESSDFIIEDGMLTEYLGLGGEVVIPSNVSVLGAHVFHGKSGLTSVILPDGLTRIDDSAFCGCYKLSGVSLPSSLETIGESAFSDCRSLSSIKIPNSVKLIGGCAFKGCNLLADEDGFVIVGNVLYDYLGTGGDIIVPEGVEVVSDYAFARCNVRQMGHVNMQSIKLPDSLLQIGNGVFEHCEDLTEIVIPEHVTDIGDHAFSRCKQLSKVSLPEGLAYIGKNAFANCSIETIHLPQSLKTLREGALSGNKLRTLELPDNIEVIEKNALAGGLYASLTLIINQGSTTDKTIKQYKKKNKCIVQYI